MFESLCTRDLRVYAQVSDGEVFHYRDKSELESDIIVKLYDGCWAAIEVKLGVKQIEEAASNLIKLSQKINTDKINKQTYKNAGQSFQRANQ